MWQLKRYFLASFESLSKLDKFNRCKNKDADGDDSAPPAPSPTSAIPLPPPFPTCAVSMAGWLAGYSENIEWKAFSIYLVSQSISHLGKRDLDGESSLASGFDPRVLWQSLGLRNLESLFHRPVSPSTRAFMASTLPLCSTYFKHILYTHIYVFAIQTHSCFFPLGSYLKKTKKINKSNLCLNPIPTLSFCVTLLETDFWSKELLPVSSVCEYTSCNIPQGLPCVLFACVFVHKYQVGFTWAGSTSLSITMEVQW